MSNVHIVRKGDTLSRISKSYGLTIKELQNINQLPDPDKLQIGQKIQLKKERVLGFQALFLDKDRNAIKGLQYQFAFAGRVLAGTTDEGGLTQKAMTATPHDEVSILVLKLDRTMKEVAKATSGYGNKLVTLVSPSIKVEGRTEPHPALKPGQLPNRKEKAKPAYDAKTDQPATAEKKKLGLEVFPAKTPNGTPLIKVEGDIPDLSFLGEYIGGTITQGDIEAAARELNCEPGLVYG
jgi:LysM repeat protein